MGFGGGMGIRVKSRVVVVIFLSGIVHLFVCVCLFCVCWVFATIIIIE